MYLVRLVNTAAEQALYIREDTTVSNTLQQNVKSVAQSVKGSCR